MSVSRSRAQGKSIAQIAQAGSDRLAVLVAHLQRFELLAQNRRKRVLSAQLEQALQQVPAQQPLALEVVRELGVDTAKLVVDRLRRSLGEHALCALVEREQLRLARRQAARLGHAHGGARRGGVEG